MQSYVLDYMYDGNNYSIHLGNKNAIQKLVAGSFWSPTDMYHKEKLLLKIKLKWVEKPWEHAEGIPKRLCTSGSIITLLVLLRVWKITGCFTNVPTEKREGGNNIQTLINHHITYTAKSKTNSRTVPA